MNFAQLRAFNAVATHRTFSSAAQALGVTQSAITQNIKSLEESVGASLFTRSGVGIELTASAYDLLPRVREVVLALEDLGARISKTRDLRMGHLSIGLCAPYVAMPIFERFSASYPGVTLNVRLGNSSSLLELVAQHDVDIAVVTLLQPSEDFVCEKLVDQQVMIVVHPGHPWWRRDRVTVAELAHQPFILREVGSMTRQIFERVMAKRGIAITTRLVLGSREAVKEAVAAGLGIGIVLSQEIGQDPRVRGIKIEDADITAGEYLVTLPRNRERGVIREFFAVAGFDGNVVS
jgi:LysR family transcriptional regulator, low CO2-responsive transcriptional regulator